MSSGSVWAAKLTLTTNKRSVSVGEEMTVLVNVEKEGNENIKSARVDIAYDPNLLKPLQINKGIYLPTLLSESIAPDGKGLVSFSTMKILGTETKDKGILGAVVFTALKPGKAAVILGKNTSVTLIGKLENVAKTSSNALIEIGEQKPTPVQEPQVQVQMGLWARFWQWLQSWWK